MTARLTKDPPTDDSKEQWMREVGLIVPDLRTHDFDPHRLG